MKVSTVNVIKCSITENEIKLKLKLNNHIIIEKGNK